MIALGGIIGASLFIDADTRAQLYPSLVSLAVILGVYFIQRARSRQE